MNLRLSNILIFIFAISFLIFPLVVSAVDYIPLVPCGLKAQPVDSQGNKIGDPKIDYTRPCTRCDTFKLAENVIDFTLLGIVPPVAAVLFIAAGLMIVLAGANPGMYAKGIAIFKSTFWGLVIILASWMIVNTFIQSFGPDKVKGNWFKFVCEDKKIAPGPPPPPPPICSDPQRLAQQYNVPFPARNAPELDALISCVNSSLGNFIDQSQIYTFQRNNSLCNYTRGNRVCGNCAHRVNSCHYGGPNGTNGSLAVDFNARGISEQELSNRLSAIRNQCNFGFILFEDNHTHVSTVSCAGDTGDGSGGGGDGGDATISITYISPTVFPAGKEASFDQNTGISSFTYLDVPFEIKGQGLSGTTLSSNNVGVDGKAGIEFKNLQVTDTSIKGIMLMHSTAKDGKTIITVRNSSGKISTTQVDVTITGTQYLQREFANNPNVKFFGRWPGIMPYSNALNAAQLAKEGMNYIDKPSYKKLNIIAYIFEPGYWKSTAENKFCSSFLERIIGKSFNVAGCASNSEQQIYLEAETGNIVHTIVHEAAHKLHYYQLGIYSPVPSSASNFQNDWLSVTKPVIKDCNYIPIQIINGTPVWSDGILQNKFIPRCSFIWAYGAYKVVSKIFPGLNQYFEDVATMAARNVNPLYNPNSGDALIIPEVYKAKYNILNKYGF